ncbi:hypothetical protein VPH35_100253 [Triticum aestivum]
MYDGERVSSVERASKRKAAGSAADSSGSGRCPSSSRSHRKKAKVVSVADIQDLQFTNTPRPLTRAKLNS